ncbi:glycosyltransferase family 2 protein [Ferruginibacter paludis]|uniref:glycosyltransferase family 2 protein n=1 Tax=Ferruginibacter paludis TaxID=1310417 RepID=UPI0025B43143|nr:glycosyltransferase family 2 protein [Ferruginibacter paludis]MDN3656765.1 glycosyltransferase family 2 protein [Ferruginibacter paludis]
MIKQPLVYCIVVTYNAMRWIDKCLQSLTTSSHRPQVIVVDNGSKDLTLSFIRDYYPMVHIIEGKKNLGFGQGNNIGLKIALEDKADHILLLNQDARVEKETIASLVKAQSDNPQFGILSPLHLNGGGSGFDVYFYDYLVRSGILDWQLTGLLNNTQEHTIIDTPFVNAAAWLISRDCLEKTGGFDPVFIHYGEDDHYANRAIFKGFKIGVLNTARIYHDRERLPADTRLPVRDQIKKDWIIFLNQACDIRRQHYRHLVLRRLARYSLFTIAKLVTFNTEGVLYNFVMAKKILFSFAKIKRSRQVSACDPLPHLQLNKVSDSFICKP